MQKKKLKRGIKAWKGKMTKIKVMQHLYSAKIRDGKRANPSRPAAGQVLSGAGWANPP